MNDDQYLLSAYGVRMPKIIYGTAWKKERTADLVEQAVTTGFRGVDTACQPKHYDEPGTGTGLGRCFGAGLAREEVYLQTKFTPVKGQDPERMPYNRKARLAEQVAQSFAVSLGNLATPYVDCLVLHSPLKNPRQLLQVWRAMEAIFAAGGAKQLGISNCYELGPLEFLYRRAKIKPAVLQNRFYADTGYDRDIRAFCRANQVQYQSFWSLTANPKVLAEPAVQTLADKYARSPAQIFFRYLTQSGITPLTGTSSPVHMREDLAIFEFALSDSECEAITNLLDTTTT